MIKRLMQQFAGGGGRRGSSGRRAHGRGGHRRSGGTGASIGSKIERLIRSRR